MTELATHTQHWIGRPAPRARARLRLFCLPYAGGGMATFRPWVALLPDDIELCLLQLPGRETRMREAPYRAVDDLVADLSTAMDPLLDRPYALVGHSMGALIAYALVQHLRAEGRPQPVQLFVSGRRPPQIPDPDPPLHTLPDAAFVAALVRRYNGIPQALLQDTELLRLFLPTLRADLTMIETYRYLMMPPLDCPIAAFGGWEDGRATQADLAAWRVLTYGDFALRMFPGGHFFIQSEGQSLVATIIATLARHATSQAMRFPERQPSAVEPGILTNACAAE